MTEMIRVLTHSCIRIEGGEGVAYVDPYQVKGAPRDADYVFATHDHYDHFSPEDIEKVAGENAVLIVPEKMKAKAEKETAGKYRIFPVKPAASYEIGALAFETVPAYNRLKPFHPKAASWVGYVIVMDGKRIYIAGDTDAIGEAKQVSCDVALVPVGGTYTMNAAQAAELINASRPETAIPTHYGSVVGGKEDAEAFRDKVDEGIQVEIIMEG